MTPKPPAWAMATASRPSVTVSMAEEITGMFSRIPRVNRVRTSVCAGITEEAAGSSKTSSKVSPSRISMRSLRLARRL